MDKNNKPHIFNPKNIEAILLFTNITMLVVQVLNLVVLKFGCMAAATSSAASTTSVVPLGVLDIPTESTSHDKENNNHRLDSVSAGESGSKEDAAFRTWQS